MGLSGIGFYIAGSIVLGLLGGLWLDNKLDSKPLFIIIGLILGIVIACYGVYKMIQPFISNQKNKGNS